MTSIAAARPISVAASGGRRAWVVLAAGGGRVAAAFERSLYLEAGDALCCMGDASLPTGPLNLRLCGLAPPCRALRAQRWTYRDGVLDLGAAGAWRLVPRTVWSPPPPRQVPAAVLAAGLRICRALPGVGVRGAAPDGEVDARVASVIHDALESLGRWLREGASHDSMPPAPRDAVLDLLGCGHGLTPSGDDVLAGVLVSLHALQRVGARRALAALVMSECGPRTGRISAAHLAAACEGAGVEPLHDLLEALAAGDERRLAMAGSALLRHGHSSGAHALAGVQCVLEALSRA